MISAMDWATESMIGSSTSAGSPDEARPKVPGSEVSLYTLADGVDDAMRMSPDYLIVGEVRDGHAAMALLRALMTLHADSPREAFERLRADNSNQESK
jgi:type IV secretory pathway ATPase VirB11/archaellum biosynthesis ATPase